MPELVSVSFGAKLKMSQQWSAKQGSRALSGTEFSSQMAWGFTAAIAPRHGCGAKHSKAGAANLVPGGVHAMQSLHSCYLS